MGEDEVPFPELVVKPGVGCPAFRRSGPCANPCSAQDELGDGEGSGTTMGADDERASPGPVEDKQLSGLEDGRQTCCQRAVEVDFRG
jgi:hypothetical protein